MKHKKIADDNSAILKDNNSKVSNLKEERHKGWWKGIAVAISITILTIIAAVLILIDFSSVNRKADKKGIVYGESTTFMSYAGPVFPLTLSEKENDITALRNTSYDFSLSDENRTHVWGANVEDTYTLTNTSSEEKTVKAMYPFVGSFRYLHEQKPVITIKDQVILPVLYPGGYTGGFTGVYGDDDPDGSSNILELDNWEGYKALLKDNNYLSKAFEPFPDLSQKVIVYTFTDFYTVEGYDAATQAISFTINTDKTAIMQYGFNGGEYGEDGFRRYSYFVPDG